MHTHKTSFVSMSPPDDILARFRQFSAERHWTITTQDRTRVHVQSGLSLRSAGEEMDVSVGEASGGGTEVHVVVTPRLGRLQLIDWGEGSIFQREILDRLGATH